MNRLMSKKIRARFIPLVLFSIFVLIPQGATASLVICFEGDGQINVEISHQGVCSFNNKNPIYEISYHPLNLKSSLDKYHYFPCKDVAISLSDLEQNIVPEQGRENLVISLLNVVGVLPQSLYLANANDEFFKHPPIRDSIISSLSSTTLLI